MVHCGKGAQVDGTKALNIKKVKGITNHFLDTMSKFDDKMGPMLLQLPYYNKKIFPNVEEFLIRLDMFLSALPNTCWVAVEVRNKNYLTPELIKVLKANQTALAITEHSNMPLPWDIMNDLDLFPCKEFTYLRLVGNRYEIESKTDTFNKVIVDKKKELAKWSKLAKTCIEMTCPQLLLQI